MSELESIKRRRGQSASSFVGFPEITSIEQDESLNQPVYGDIGKAYKSAKDYVVDILSGEAMRRQNQEVMRGAEALSASSLGKPYSEEDLDKFSEGMASAVGGTINPVKGKPGLNKFIDEDYFHITNKQFDKFKPSKDGSLGPGIYASKEPLSQSVGDVGANVRPLKVSGTFVDIDSPEWDKLKSKWQKSKSDKNMFEWVKDNTKYDGIREAGDIVSFSDSSIKSKFELPELPMDEASRMARAKEMGFDTDKTWYHGTGGNIEAFNPELLGANTTGPSKGLGVHLSKSPELANEYAKESAPDYLKKATKAADIAIDAVGDAQKSLIEKYGKDRSKWPHEAEELVRNKTADFLHAQDQLEYSQRKADKADWTQGVNVIPTHLKLKNPAIIDLEGGMINSDAAKLAQKYKDSGKYDGVIFKNAYDTPGPFRAGEVRAGATDVAVVFDPSQIRSKFAEFDPSKAKSGNISAGIGAVGAAGLLGSGVLSDEAQASEDPLLKAIRSKRGRE